MTNVIDLILPFWEKARIPTKLRKHAIVYLETFFQQWKNIQRNRSRRSPTQIAKEEEFQKTLEQLFDIAHQNVMEPLTINAEKTFFFLNETVDVVA